MFHTEREGDRHFIKQELEACVESTNKLAAEERRQHFEYVDVASVNKDTDDVSTDEPGGPSSSQIVKEETEDKLSVHEDECLWSLKTSSLCYGKSVKQDVPRNHSDHSSSGSECETQFHQYAGLYSVLQGGDNMDTGIQFSEIDVVHISDKTHVKTDKSMDAWLHKQEGSQERKLHWYRQVAIEEKARLLQKKRDAARGRYRQMVGEEKVRFLQKKREAIRNRYDEMTDEEKARLLQKLREARNERYRQMSGEQKARILQKKREAARKRYRQMTGDDKVRFLQKKRDAVRNRSTQMVDEDKAHMLEKKRVAARNRYRKMANDEKERLLLRKRSEAKNRYRQKQVGRR